MSLVAKNETLKANEDKIKDGLKKNAFVAVFQVDTQNGKTTIKDDAVAKVDAMYASGVRTFEFLMRGSKGVVLDTDSPLGLTTEGVKYEETYTAQVLAAIDHLSTATQEDGSLKYPEAVFGCGTISNPHMMQAVTTNPNVKFVMTAHYPGSEMVDIAVRNNVPILATSSYAKGVKITEKDGGEIVEPEEIEKMPDGSRNPDFKGNDKLDPEHIAELRKAGSDFFKVSNFTEIAKRRAVESPNQELRGGKNWGQAAAEDPLTRVAFGLIATAEAIRASYALHSETVLSTEEFYAATTGGVTAETLPYLAAGLKSPKVEQKIREILRSEKSRLPVTDNSQASVLDILGRTTLGCGGTYLTNDYNKMIKNGTDLKADQEQAAVVLKQAATGAMRSANAAAMGQIVIAGTGRAV